MKTRGRRFSTRAELLTAIDDCQFKLKMAIKKCGQHEAERERLRTELLPLGALELEQMTEDQRVHFHALDRKRRHHEEEGDKLLKSMPQLHGRLARLKQCLGKLDTATFSFVEDGSVVA